MTSSPSSTATATAPPKWQTSIHWSTTLPFRVHWIVKCWTPFSRVGGLKNSLNENLPVLVGKDGQEIEEGCGWDLVRVLQDEVEMEILADGFGQEGKEV